MQPEMTRTRIFSHITRSRFLHIEDSLEIGKLRFFVGAYEKGQGAQSTAYHFLDADDARPICADLAWGKPLDIKDYKGSANGGDVPLSRVLTIRGPKEGKYWLEIQNGPGQIIGQGAVKPMGEPEASVSIALSVWEARKMALAIQEYMAAWRVVALLHPSEASRPPVDPPVRNNPPEAAPIPAPMPKVEGRPSARADAEALFGPEEPAGRGDSANRPPDGPPAFYSLANQAIAAGFPLERLQEIIKSQSPWREKTTRLQAAMAS